MAYLSNIVISDVIHIIAHHSAKEEESGHLTVGIKDMAEERKACQIIIFIYRKLVI